MPDAQDAKMAMKSRHARPEDRVAYHDLAALIGRHAANVSALELLAIAANIVGKMIGLQDQKTVTPRQAMEIVLENIQAGNAEIIATLRDAKGNG